MTRVTLIMDIEIINPAVFIQHGQDVPDLAYNSIVGAVDWRSLGLEVEYVLNY